MAVTIVIPTPLRQFVGGSSEVEVNAATAGDALRELTAEHGELRKHLYNEQDKLRNFIAYTHSTTRFSGLLFLLNWS